MKIIGIDPDLRKNGVAIMENGEYKELVSLAFPRLLSLISDSESDETVLFVVEDVNANKPTFSRGRMSIAARDKISQNIGMVKGVGSVIVEMLDFFKCNYVLVKPLKGTLKQCKSKPEVFERLTGWKGRSNADTRDAATLIYRYQGMKFRNVSEINHGVKL